MGPMPSGKNALNVPSGVADQVVDFATRKGFQFTEQVFYSAALDAGYGTRAEDIARQLDTTWRRQGYEKLPTYVKDFLLRTFERSKQCVSAKTTSK